MRFKWYSMVLLRKEIIRKRNESKGKIYEDAMEYLEYLTELSKMERKYWDMGGKDLKFTVN